MPTVVSINDLEGLHAKRITVIGRGKRRRRVGAAVDGCLP
jgi:hypothetical protein